VAFRVTQPARRARREHSAQRVFGISRDLQRNSGGIFLEPKAMAGAGDRNNIGPTGQYPGERKLELSPNFGDGLKDEAAAWA
jgi:hypothetical protein